jgi:hypothetical protein
MQMRAVRGEEDVTETFAGSLTLLPKTKKRRMKIRAFFVQIFINGAFAIAPTLSFHAIIPGDSKVFECIKWGNLEGLIELLEKGLASLTDCDPDRHSLLWVGFDALG